MGRGHEPPTLGLLGAKVLTLSPLTAVMAVEDVSSECYFLYLQESNRPYDVPG